MHSCLNSSKQHTTGNSNNGVYSMNKFCLNCNNDEQCNYEESSNMFVSLFITMSGFC